MQSISILVLCLIAHVSIEIPRCKWFSLGPTSKLLYFPSLPLLLCSSMAIANIAHAGKTELPVVLSHDVRVVLSPTIKPLQKSNTSINIFTLLQQYQSQMLHRVFIWMYAFSSFGWASCFGKCISKRWLYQNDKIDRSVKSLYYLIINHCTGLNWSDWRFKRSLKLLFTHDQLHTSLTDEILMKNWPKSNNATDPGVIYLKRCLPFTVDNDTGTNDNLEITGF